MQVSRCEVCGNRTARYVCQECGRQVCERCLEPSSWVCSECDSILRPELSTTKVSSSSIPVKLFLLGFFLVFVGISFIIVSAIFFEAPLSVGTVIFIGPIPIVAGTGPYSVWAILLAVGLTILSLVLFILFRRQTREI